MTDQLEELGALFHEDEQLVYNIHSLVTGNKDQNLKQENKSELLKLGIQRNELKQQIDTKIEYIEDLVLYAIPETNDSYLSNNPDIIQLKKLWMNITEKTDIDIKVVNVCWLL